MMLNVLGKRVEAFVVFWSGVVRLRFGSHE